MSPFIRRCGECDERWCLACESECPVCLIGAGMQSSVVKCAHCEYDFCQLCDNAWECPDCLRVLCKECWDAGLDCPCRSELEEDESSELAQELPPGFSLIPEDEFVDWSAKDPRTWRAWWGRKQKPKPWKEQE
jgi:hypothetical protein